MTATRALERHTPDGETHVVERDAEGRITGVSNALHYSDWRDEDTGKERTDLNLWDWDFEDEDRYTSDDERGEAADFLAGFA